MNALRADLTNAIENGELNGLRRYIDDDCMYMAQRARCSCCGHRGLDHVGFRRMKPYIFRAFTICPECGEEREI